MRDQPARDREQHARAVARLRIRGERATVTELREALQPELHHSAVGTTRDVCHESDPARVPLERPVGPGTSARGEPSVERRHGSPPRLRSERTTYVAGVSSPFRPYERCVTTPAARRARSSERHTAVTRGTSLRNCGSLRSPEERNRCHRTCHGTRKREGTMVKTLRRRLADGRTRKSDRHDLRGEDAGRDRGAVRDQPDRRADRHARIGARGDAQGERFREPRSTRCGCSSPPSSCSSCRPGSWRLEAGFARSRETVNILIECIVDTCLCGLLFWAFGFAFMFGAGNGLIGHAVLLPARRDRRPTARPAWRSWRSGCSSSRSPTPHRRSRRAPWSVAPASRATSSTAIGCPGFIYPIFGHWVWGPGGWLGNTMAGSQRFTAAPVP